MKSHFWIFNFRLSKIHSYVKLISILFILHPNLINAENLYRPNGKLMGKLGVSRSLARLGIVIPILQRSENLVYLPIIGMLDINNTNELNLGIGYRQIVNQNYILGGYSFFDYRKSQYDNYFKQITLGLELFFQRLEFRTNIYLPEKKSKFGYSKKIKNVSVNYDGVNTEHVFSNSRTRYKEIPNYGGDIEVGVSINYDNNIYLAYYHFFNKINSNVINGIRVRSTYQYTDVVTYDAEISYDNKRKFNAFVGFSVSFVKRQANFSLLNKMTMLPIRDVDIVVDVDETALMEDVVTNSYDGYVPLIDLEMFTKLSLGGNGTQDNVFITAAAMNAARDVDDIVIHTKGDFVLLSSLNKKSLDSGSPLVKQYNELYLLVLRKNSPLYKTYQTGFWTSSSYEEKMKQQFDLFKSKYPGLSIDNISYNKILAGGVPRQTTYEILEFFYREISNVKVVLHGVNSDTDSIVQNVTSLRAEVNRTKAGQNDQRYIVANFAMNNHATALIVDRQDHIFYHMDSNHIKLSDKQKNILQQVFGSGYSYNYPETPRQKESWSCAQHTVQNIMDFSKGYIQSKIVGTNRDMSFILEKNLYLHSAYRNSGKLAPVTLQSVRNTIDCRNNFIALLN